MNLVILLVFLHATLTSGEMINLTFSHNLAETEKHTPDQTEPPFYVDAIDYYNEDTVSSLGRASHEEFCYTKDKCGPSKWKGICQTGQNQSPIDINPQASKITKRENASAVLQFKPSYGQHFKRFFMTNNGHTVVAQISADGRSSVEFCHIDLKSCYLFSQLHFHWASQLDKGSEHTLNQKSHEMEIHLVHYKKSFKNLGEAIKSNDDSALGIFAVFVKVGPKNPHLESILDLIQQNTLKPMKNKMLRVAGNLNIGHLIPHKNSFYRYHGSLTVPPCTEKILWTVFTEPIVMSAGQMGIFRKIHAPREVLNTMNNFRPTKPLNGRNLEFFT